MKSIRTELLAAASAVALMAAAPAYADTHEGAGATVKSTTQIKAEELVGKDIKNLSGDTIGEIDSVIVDQQGKVAAIIVEVGGFLGLGERTVALDWNDLKYRPNGNVVQSTMTKAQLKALPEYKYEAAQNRRKAFVDDTYLAERSKSGDGMAVKSEWVTATGMRTSKLIGANVVNPQGETIGEVSDVLVDNGKPMLVLSVGEFLGMGGHEATVPLEKVTVYRQRDDADDLRVSLSMSKAQVKAMPEFDAKAWRKDGRMKR